MDSFCSLFDPTDGLSKPAKNKTVDQDNVKKKGDTPKGRRKGRKSQGPSVSLPEESSFLCEPQLDNEVLLRDESYIDTYIKREESPNDNEKRFKRRVCNRKFRRRRSKVSPATEMSSTEAWVDDQDVNWNNRATPPRPIDHAIGKNVNDISSLPSVMDKLEKVSLNDFRDEEDSEEFEDLDEGSDKSISCLARLPPEPRFGNVEYKLQLVNPGEKRLQHLVTQLKWRLASGAGSAVYVIGVRDCGQLRGLSPTSLRDSLATLKLMSRALGATIAHVCARRVASNLAVAEVHIKRLADAQKSVELRVAVMGANEAGKSTLIGVLTQGELDNGFGSARLNMFRHLHEVRSGRTSSLSHEILGFDAQGNVVNYGCSELMTTERIGERSSKLVCFLDLAGHSKYQRTTLHGISGYCPHVAMLLISATAGLTRITEEHLTLLLALEVPFFVVITKCELANTVGALVKRLEQLLEPRKKKPLLISDEKSLSRLVVAPQKLLLDLVDEDLNDNQQNDKEDSCHQIPVFPVSCVRGSGLSSLHAYLLALQPPDNFNEMHLQDTCEFQIDEIFHTSTRGEVVVGGFLARGVLYEGDELLVGPLPSGEFAPTSLLSIHSHRRRRSHAAAGHSASLLLATDVAVRAGMAILSKKPPPETTNSAQTLQNIKLARDMLTKHNVDRVNLTVTADRNDSDSSDDAAAEDPSDPRGCMFFQACVSLLQHSTVISAGFQCTVHAGNVRQTALIEGIMSCGGGIKEGERASMLFRFVKCPEYLVRGRRMLFTAGGGTRAIGRITQVFPYYP